LATNARGTDVSSTIDKIVTRLRLGIASTSGRVATEADVARVGRGWADLGDIQASQRVVARVGRARISVVAVPRYWVALAGGRVARVGHAGGVRLVTSLCHGVALERGVATWQLAQVGSLDAKWRGIALSTRWVASIREAAGVTVARLRYGTAA